MVISSNSIKIHIIKHAFNTLNNNKITFSIALEIINHLFYLYIKKPSGFKHIT